MKFRNYCIVIMSNTSGVLAEIEKISETKVNVLDAKGLLIATFSSLLEPPELTELFKDNNRNFLLFDLAKESSGVNFVKETIHQGLFGFISEINLEKKSKQLMESIQETRVVENIINRKPIKEIELTEEEIASMNTSQRKEKFDEILDKGVDNFTENDKKMMSFLVK